MNLYYGLISPVALSFQGEEELQMKLFDETTLKNIHRVNKQSKK
jgi:hypothetical protein